MKTRGLDGVGLGEVLAGNDDLIEKFIAEQSKVETIFKNIELTFKLTQK